jgi:hypothetical protein
MVASWKLLVARHCGGGLRQVLVGRSLGVGVKSLGRWRVQELGLGSGVGVCTINSPSLLCKVFISSWGQLRLSSAHPQCMFGAA